ncbi:hypothetical protein [Dactylosporangium salmoneum]|uniref:Lipoprotein n=1 Tax=Dactylosporangium salmoneum TaxID=53361 RepID=A0ABN3HSM9_9ACTN
MDGGSTNIDDAAAQAEIDKEAAEPASMYRPTPVFLASLPADPQQLLTYLRQWVHDTYPDRPADSMIWKDAYELIHYSEPFWTPQQRAAIYKALGAMPDVKATTATIAGTGYDLVCMVRTDVGPGDQADCLLFESATGRFAGDATAGTGMALTAATVDLVDYGTQPRPAPGVKPTVDPSLQGSHAPKPKK